MSSDLVQISALVGGAGVALGYIIRFIVVVWSLTADEKGREHAVAMIWALRGERSKRVPPNTSP